MTFSRLRNDKDRHLSLLTHWATLWSPVTGKGLNLGFLDTRITLGLSKAPDFPGVTWATDGVYLRQEGR